MVPNANVWPTLCFVGLSACGLDLPPLPEEELTNAAILPAVPDDGTSDPCGEPNQPQTYAPFGTVTIDSDGDVSVCVGDLGIFPSAILPIGGFTNEQSTALYVGVVMYDDPADGELHYIALGVEDFPSGIGSGCSSSYSFDHFSGSIIAGNAYKDDLWVGQGICTTEDAFLGVEDDLTVVRLVFPNGDQAVVKLKEV